MAKVRYKELPKGFQEMVQPSQTLKTRASVGMEQSIGEFYYIPIEKLKPFSKQARRVFDELEIEGLAATIQEHGISQPLAVIRSDNDTFEIISGERRYRAAIKVGLKKIPCIILDATKNADEIALIENIQRADLHPLEISNAIAELLKNSGRGDQQDLANRLGLPKSKVSEYLSYQNIPEEVRQLIIEKKVRGRELLRKFANATNKTAKDLLQTISITPQHVISIDNHDIKTRTVMRIAFEHNQLKVQKRGLRHLTDPEKQIIKTKLIEILKELN